MTSIDYDVVIIGGGVAGASLAALMAEAGFSVFVLERETVFRDRVRGEWLAPWGVSEVRACGLEDALASTHPNQIDKIVNRVGRPRPLTTPEGVASICFFHPAAQEALLQYAIQAGATVQRGARVRDVAPDQPRTVGYLCEGEQRSVRGRLVVGADGRTSIARKALNAREREHRSSRLLAGVRLGGLDCADDVGFFLIRDDATGMASLFPQGDGYARAYVFVEGIDPQRYAGEEGFRHFIDAQIESGVPAAVFADATQEGPLAAFEASDSWVDRAARDGLALIGDAAGVSDPTWGFGLALAFRDVRTLRDALVATPDWDAALETYSTAHADYFAKILEGENWQSDLFLTPGPEAAARRMHAVRAWSDDPSRSIDLVGEGPSTDLSAAARVRFFAEDLAGGSLA